MPIETININRERAAELLLASLEEIADPIARNQLLRAALKNDEKLIGTLLRSKRKITYDQGFEMSVPSFLHGIISAG